MDYKIKQLLKELKKEQEILQSNIIFFNKLKENESNIKKELSKILNKKEVNEEFQIRLRHFSHRRLNNLKEIKRIENDIKEEKVKTIFNNYIFYN